MLRSIPLDDLPPERVWGEVEKLLLAAERPSVGLALARDLDIVSRHWPELHALIDCPQEPEWHPEGDVWIHTLMVVDEARQRIADLSRGPALAMMLGAVCHDLGKPAATAFIDGPSIAGHEEALRPPSLLDRWNVHTIDGFDLRHAVLGLARTIWLRKSPTPVGDGAFRRLARK